MSRRITINASTHFALQEYVAAPRLSTMLPPARPLNQGRTFAFDSVSDEQVHALVHTLEAVVVAMNGRTGLDRWRVRRIKKDIGKLKPKDDEGGPALPSPPLEKQDRLV